MTLFCHLYPEISDLSPYTRSGPILSIGKLRSPESTDPERNPDNMTALFKRFAKLMSHFNVIKDEITIRGELNVHVNKPDCEKVITIRGELNVHVNKPDCEKVIIIRGELNVHVNKPDCAKVIIIRAELKVHVNKPDCEKVIIVNLMQTLRNKHITKAIHYC